MKSKVSPTDLKEEIRRLPAASDYEGVLLLAKQVLASEADCQVALFHLALSLYELDRTYESLTVWRKLRRLDPEYPNVSLNIGCVYGKLGRHELAAKWFKRELRVNPVSGEALFNLGMHYYHRKARARSALPFLEKAFKQGHSRAEIVEPLADAYFKTRQLNNELLLYKEWLADHPNDTWCLNNFGAALMHDAEYARAILYLRRAAAIDPSDEMVLRNLKKAETLMRAASQQRHMRDQVGTIELGKRDASR